MKFCSTRNKDLMVSGSEAILKGISDDGGLFVPKYIPSVKGNLEIWQTLDYNSLAVEILALYFNEFSKKALTDMVVKAYEGKFAKKQKVSVASFKQYNFLELYHGPTAAFKDMALCLLPYIMKEAAKVQNDTKERIVLTATSGDTGKAALEGFKNIKPYKVIVFYPETGVSPVQKQQMISSNGDNSFVVALKGNFDDAQKGVKEMFADKNLAKSLAEKNMVLSSANSINIGRLIPQIVYYFYGYFEMIRQGKIMLGEEIDISVPTGNFGNILASYMAKSMGLPIDNIICASNTNNVLTDFINTGIYSKKRKFYVTVAPSMDILVSSNLERYLYFVSNGNAELIKDLMEKLRIDGEYTLPKDIREKICDLKGYCYDDEKVLEEINEVFNTYSYLMDTHTAIGYLGAKEESNKDVLIASTASPFKFTGAVSKALSISGETDEFKLIKILENFSNQNVPDCLEDLENQAITQNRLCGIEEMKETIEKILEV